jgi:hypothetical protein
MDLIPVGLLMDEFSSSAEKHRKGALIVQEFRTSGLPSGPNSRLANITGPANFNASVLLSEGSSGTIYDDLTLRILRNKYSDVDYYPDFSQVSRQMD